MLQHITANSRCLRTVYGFICVSLACMLSLASCNELPEFEFTQNMIFLVGDNGEGKSWRLVKAEIPIRLANEPEKMIFDILQHPEFACYRDDTLAFFLPDSLWIGQGNTLCAPGFEIGATNRWRLEKVGRNNEQLIIARSRFDKTIEYRLPISLLNRTRFISELVLPLDSALNIEIMGTEVEVWQLDLTLEFQTLETR